jgi:hypothetical protein
MSYRPARSIPFVLICLTAGASSSLAQTQDDQPVLPATPVPLVEPVVAPSAPSAMEHAVDQAGRIAAMRQWTREYTEWKKWHDRWKGKPEPGWFSVRERRQKPDPPIWLFDECQDLADVESTRAPAIADACQLIQSWQEDAAAAQLKTQTLNARSRSEDDTKTTFWNHVHADALWITPSSSASYGAVGIHVTFRVAGRWQVFAAPGAILLNVSLPDGKRAWQPATDLGFSYRLLDITLPGNRQSTLHLNVVRAWILGGPESLLNSSVDLAGLSLTFK